MIIFVLLAVFAATLLIFGYLTFIWWLDRYEREPFWIVILTFAWGALGGTCLSCVINSTIGANLTVGLGQVGGNVITSVVVAPVVEEVMKGLIFVPLIVIGKNVDNRTDGLIYGAAAGLGFACLENLWYYANLFDLNNPGGVLPVIFMRTLFTTLMHCISSALLGMAIGYARHRAGALRWIIYPAMGYAAAVISHATWNGLATMSGFIGQEAAELAAATMLLGVGLVALASIMMFVLTQLSLHSEHKFIRQYLLEEARRGVIPVAHAEVIPYWLKRRRRGWLPEGVNKAAYIKAATLLAFRHWQLEIADDERRHQYLEDITMYRDEIAKLLHGR